MCRGTNISSGAGSSAENLAKLTGDTTVWMNVTRIENNSTAEQAREWAVSALEEAVRKTADFVPSAS